MMTIETLTNPWLTIWRCHTFASRLTSLICEAEEAYKSAVIKLT
jgi:hypothetical protein